VAEGGRISDLAAGTRNCGNMELIAFIDGYRDRYIIGNICGKKSRGKMRESGRFGAVSAGMLLFLDVGISRDSAARSSKVKYIYGKLVKLGCIFIIIGYFLLVMALG
jgi:hypothetical protein